MFRIVQISDTHLPATGAQVSPGWREVVRFVELLRPDLVVHTGDIIWGEPDNEADHCFARKALDGLGVEWLAIPGNHDVGDGPPREQTVTASLINKFVGHYSHIRWVRDVEAWRLIGINSMVFGTGVGEEEKEWAFLDDALSGADGRQVLLFVHKPPFVLDPEEHQVGSASFPEAIRKKFWSKVVDRKVRVIACGHRHEYRVLQRDGISVVWAPTTSALLDEYTPPVDPMGVKPGLVEYVIKADTLLHRVISFDAPDASIHEETVND
jgi:3',5'-cyclic AMP phosphodiesterase CpdA